MDVSAIQEPLAFILPKREMVFSLDGKEPAAEPGPSAPPEGGREEALSAEPAEPPPEST